MLTVLVLLLHGAEAAPAREVAAYPDAHVQRPTWSPDGLRLAYETNDHVAKRITTWIGSPDAGDFQAIRPPGAGSSGRASGFATRSTEAKVVAELSWAPPHLNAFVYASSKDGVDSDLFIDRSPTPFATHPAPDGGPAWSPDGRFIAFTSARTGEGDLYVQDLRALSGEPRQLTALMGSSEVFATWTPDSQGIAYIAHGRSGDNLWLLPTLDGTPVQLTRWSGVQTRPSFSPDGEWLAFYANHEDEARFDLYIMRPMHLSPPTLVLPDIVPNDAGPVWSPDSRYVFSVVDDDANYDPIVAVPVDDHLAAAPLVLDTVGHGDFDVEAGPGGSWRIAYTALGRRTDTERAFRRLYVGDVELSR